MLFEERIQKVEEYVRTLVPLRPFRHVSEPLSDPQVMVLASAEQAMESITNHWENAWLDARNEVSSRLVLTGNRPAYQLWNDIAKRYEDAAQSAGITAEIAMAVEVLFPRDYELVAHKTNLMVGSSVIEWCYEPLVYCTAVRDFTKWVFEGRLTCGVRKVKGQKITLVF
jgi:hypothetical protein